MKTSGATDANVRRWLEEEHEIEVSRSTFSRFKKKYHITDKEKDPRARDKDSLTNRVITQGQIIDNEVHTDNIDLAIDTILQQQVTDIKTGLDNIDRITKNAVGIEIDFAKLDQEVRYNANEKSLARYLIDLTELKIRYLELSVKAFEAKNRLFKDEMDRLFKNRVLELEDKKIEISQKDIMNEIEILAKQLMITMYNENNEFYLSARDKAILQKCVYENPYMPFNPFPKQAEMILAREKEVLIGGAAGGSKSTSLLMRALFYVQDDANEYHALILRRTLSDLKRKGALIHKASQWLNRKEIQNNASIKPKWDGTEHSWTFPNGNSLTFGYLRNINDLDTYQGSEYQFIGIDELTQLERFKYIYMRSRVRKTKDNKLPTQLMASSNPGKCGNKWVRERFIEKIDNDIQDKSQIRFISSSYLDNIYLDRNDYEEYLMGLDRVTREQLMNGNWYASVKGQLFDESDFHIISHDEYMKIPIIKIIRYWNLAATEVLNDDKLRGSDPDYTAGVLLAKDLNGNIYILDSYEFQLESRNLINEILNTAACDKSDVRYIELDGSTGKNFGLLIIDELNRRGFTTGTGNSRENKIDRARRVLADIQKNGIFRVGKDRTGFTKKWAMEFLEKITAYPNEAIHDDCVVAFTGGYEKIVSEKQIQRVDVDRWYST